MEKEKQFLLVLQSILEQDAETAEKAGDIFNQMINQDPDELAMIHLKIISSTDNDSLRNLALIFFGRFFSLLIKKKITLSEKISEFIQNSLFSLFQKENFTKKNYDYLAYDIYKCASYYQESWPQLPELLLELINSDSIFSKSLLDCFSECISSKYINTDRYFELLCNFIGDFLSSGEPKMTNLSSILKLLYSLAKTKNYQPKEIFIPLFDEVPIFLEYSIRCEDNLKIINDFLTNVSFNFDIFDNSYKKYFETFIKMISDPNCESIRNTLILILSKLITAFYFNFKGEFAIKIFDFYVENYNEKTSQLFDNSIYELSNLFGEDKEFSIHILEFLQNNSPNPVVFRAFASSFNGIKNHFSDPNLTQSLIDILSTGFQSDDECRKEFFLCLKCVIKDIPISDLNFPVIEIIDEISKVIQKEEEENIEIIQVLGVLLDKFSEIISQNIEEIVKMIDSLINESDHIETQIELFNCYRIISLKYQKEFLPHSQNYVSKINEIINNPQYEQIFFFVNETLPFLKYLMKQENLNELLSLSFSFLFSEVYDEEENINDCFIEYQNSIIKFFLNCLENDTMCDSEEVIKKVIKIAFQNVSFNIEKVEKDDDLSEFYCCQLFYDENEQLYNIISNSEIEKIQNSVKILNLIYQDKKELFDLFEKDKNQLIQEIFEYLFVFKNSSITKDIFIIDKLILPFLTSKDDFSQILLYNIQFFFKKSVEIELNKFISFLKVYIKCIGDKWKENYQQINEIIESLYKISIDLLSLVYVQYKAVISNNESNATVYIEYFVNTQINAALILRELYKNFSNHALNYFHLIIKDVLFTWPSMIIHSDFIRFCVNDVAEKRNFIEGILNVKDEKQKNKLHSLYALSVVSEPYSFDSESMCNLLKSVLIDSNEFEKDEKRLIVFILLQVFTNYSSLFDLSDFFWNLFDSDSYLIPDFCIEYFAMSLFSFVRRFGDSIPNDKLEDVVSVIQNLKENGNLDDMLSEKLKFLLENCFTQNQ